MALTRRGFMATGGAFFATALSAATPGLLQIEGPAFGAGWRVRVTEKADAGAIADAIMQVVATVGRAMSPFGSSSEISVFNRTETLDWLPLSFRTLTTIAEAQRIAVQTRGAFDPTLGGLVGRYGFGPINTAPAGAFADLAIGMDGARKGHARQTLDLCGIAKGHALDACAEALRSMDIDSFFIEMGGEVSALGARPDGSPWRVGIENPVPGIAAARYVVALDGEALATSGDLVNGYMLGGRRYSHIIDPRRMAPADSALASVSVFAPKAIAADALATALFAMGPERGPAFAVETGTDALFLSRDGAGLREIMTCRFSERIMME